MAAENITATVLHGAQDLRITTRDILPPSPEDVQIAIRSTGLCGSDLHYFNHFRNGDILVREPLTLGHESSGVVVACGSAVRGLDVGDRVAVEVGLPCDKCDYCAQGRYNICRDMRFRSSAKSFPHFQGTLQDKINHPAKFCHKLPDAIPNDLGALIEPLSVAMHASRRAALPRASTILVLGAGAVGLLAAALSKAAGSPAVVIADIQKDRVDFALAHGFADAGFVVPLARPQSVDEKLQYARDVADMAKAALVAGAPVGEVDAVYECTGVESCMQSAIYAAKPGGKILIIGMGTPVLTLPMSAAALREVDLVGVFRYANTYPAAIEMLSNRPAGLPDLQRLVTHRFSGMGEVEDAFRMAGKVKDDQGRLVIKVMVDFA
ncbi:Sorbitol dehydrogenase [Escovopsis weberi]|uniref:Sorbitol dehydrogenase n=1 Tax=Escovopsis weberi TaxID=150374 RepID=A0A0M8N7X3_ESCWE|nr:Sorbitol dehydrogenase [Escovopsis weberi]